MGHHRFGLFSHVDELIIDLGIGVVEGCRERRGCITNSMNRLDGEDVD